MTSSMDYKKEWFAKAEVDYFPHFLSLWMACNSWYNICYPSLNTDRKIINALKSDTSNDLYRSFDRVFLGSPTKEQKGLYSNLQLLYYSLNRARLQPSNLLVPLSYSSMLVDFSRKNRLSDYINIVTPRDTGVDERELESSDIDVIGIDLGDIVILSDVPIVFAGILEIIYQVRCMLVHGEIDPKTEENHEVVKYCYLILHDLMKDFCS